MSADAWPEIIVIGTGQAAVPLASRLAAAGRRVLIAERGAAGGTCVNIGCTPTKTLVASARAAHVARTAAALGVRTADVQVDFAAVMARKDGMVARWRQGVERRLAAAGENLRFIRGHARFVDARTVEISGVRYQAPQVVINVGARAAWPAVPDLRGVGAVDSSGALNLRALPRHLLVLGGGYIACEMGQMFRRFGAEVTIVQSAPRLLSREDADVSVAIEGVFRSEGIEVMLGKRAREVTRDGNGVTLTLEDVRPGGEDKDKDEGRGKSVPDRAPDPEAQRVRGSAVLVATGRRPNTDDLGCEAAGISLDERGYIQVDERYQTTVPGVYAAGDCTPGPQYTHVSWDDHRVLFDVLTGRPARPRSARVVPYAVFTDPQVAGVGVSEGEARARGIACEVATMPFGSIARAIETGETAGVVKVLIDPATEHVLGARVVGAEAGELIHVFSLMIQAKASARVLVDAEFVHPALAEGLQTAVMKLPRFALS